MRLRANTHGFTVVELMIATAVFSVVLLTASVALLNIGRMFYKSVNIINTQETVRNITDDVSQSVQFAGDNVQTAITANGGSQGFCIGSRRYSYLPDTQLTDANHVMVVDTMASGTCNSATLAVNLAGGLADPATGAALINPRELASRGTRIAAVSLGCPLNTATPDPNDCLVPGLYTFRVRVVFGADDTLTPDRQNCLDSDDRQYCATADLTTSIQKRIQ